MTRDELITKQQLEIEELKIQLLQMRNICIEARNELIYAEQWSPKCPDFPRVAMNAIVKARYQLEE